MVIKSILHKACFDRAKSKSNNMKKMWLGEQMQVATGPQFMIAIAHAMHLHLTLIFINCMTSF